MRSGPNLPKRQKEMPTYRSLTGFIGLLGAGLFVAAGCGSQGNAPLSPAEAKAQAQQQIEAINKRTDMPPAAKAQVISHIESNLQHDTNPHSPPGRKSSNG